MTPPPQNDTKFKIFIGGTTPDTDEEVLKEHFERYGTIVDCVIMKHPQTNRPRGFGFVSFSNQEEVDKCMSDRPHTLKGRQVEIKRAMPRDISSQNPENNVTVKKIFLGGLKDVHNEENLKDYFKQFGSVESVEVVKDPQTGRMRGFGFLTFDDYDAVDRVILNKPHTVNGSHVDTKKALPKEQQMGGGGGGGGGGGSMRGGSRGGSMRGGMRGGRGRGGGGGHGGHQGGYGGNHWDQGGGGYGHQGGYGNQGYGNHSGGYGPGPGGDYNSHHSGGGSGGGGGPSGWNQAAYQTNSAYGQHQNWDPSQYGQNYNQNFSGGPMKSQNAYNQRASGPYGSGYGNTTGNGTAPGPGPGPAAGGYQSAVGGAAQQTAYAQSAYNSAAGSYPPQ